MPHHRYLPRKVTSPDDETLPLDTVCTILVRQSSAAQTERNVFSSELSPEELIRQAMSKGFPIERIKLLDWDMGISAYDTTIEERPALHHWLADLLPTGQSRVVMTSMEDRLFRDRTEIQVNRFIEEVNKHQGWVICNGFIYNFRQDFHRERFRQMCKQARMYIEFQIKGRLHPAIHRAAMQGRYVGGHIPWGYIVDYRDPKSPTFKHFIPYEQHASLVVNEIFHRFASMPLPGLTALQRYWWQEGLVWPMFGPEIDSRVVRAFKARRRLTNDGRGFEFNLDQGKRILTNIVYLGWMYRADELAMETTGEPKICHQPLIEPDLFWWCFDRLMDERSAWAPPRNSFVLPKSRSRQSSKQLKDEAGFLAHGLIRCAQHQRRMIVASPSSVVRHYELRCELERHEILNKEHQCISLSGSIVEDALSLALVEQLTLDERDIQALAVIAERRDRGKDNTLAKLERQLIDHKAAYDAAKAATLEATRKRLDLASDFLEDMVKAKSAIRKVETRIVDAHKATKPSVRAWAAAQQAYGWAKRIQETFQEWSRIAKAKVLQLALEEAVIGYITRTKIGIWAHWQGEGESRQVIARQCGRRLPWTADEEAALRAYFHVLTPVGLCAMLPSRTFSAIWGHAYKFGLSRVEGALLMDTPPVVVTAPEVSNDMANYGFVTNEEIGHESEQHHVHAELAMV